jgi:Zn-dependent M32 family carboxypeptidase
MDSESDDACLVLRTAHDYDKQTKVPTEKVAEFARVTTMAESAWEKARENNDFSLFEPNLPKWLNCAANMPVTSNPTITFTIPYWMISNPA